MAHSVYHINGVLSFVYVDSVDDKCLSVGLGLVLWISWIWAWTVWRSIWWVCSLLFSFYATC